MNCCDYLWCTFSANFVTSGVCPNVCLPNIVDHTHTNLKVSKKGMRSYLIVVIKRTLTELLFTVQTMHLLAPACSFEKSLTRWILAEKGSIVGKIPPWNVISPTFFSRSEFPHISPNRWWWTSLVVFGCILHHHHPLSAFFSWNAGNYILSPLLHIFREMNSVRVGEILVFQTHSLAASLLHS